MEAYIIASLVVAAGLGFIPASIAKIKVIVLAFGGFMDGCFLS